MKINSNERAFAQVDFAHGVEAFEIMERFEGCTCEHIVSTLRWLYPEAGLISIKDKTLDTIWVDNKVWQKLTEGVKKI